MFFAAVIIVGVEGVVEQRHEAVIAMAGSVYKRCGCRDPITGSSLGARCPLLATDGHGSWFFSVELPADADGSRRRLRRGGYPSRSTARAAANRVIGACPVVDVEFLSVAEWLKRWLDSRLSIRPETARSYAGHIGNYLVPYLGSLLLVELRRADVQAAFGAIVTAGEATGAPLTAATLHRIYATLRAALNEAVRVGAVGVNPAVGVELPAAVYPHPAVWTPERTRAWQQDGTRPIVPVWTPAQTAAFLAFVRGHRLYALFHLVALTGLRRGEVCALRWADVNLDGAVVSIICQRRQTAGHIALAPPKSAAGIRQIALDHTTVTALRQHRHRQQAEYETANRPWTESGYTFTCRDGRPLSPDRLTRAFASLVRGSGLPPVTLHGLRHGAATIALAAGVEMKVVQAMLGHSSIAVTADIYTAVLPQAAHHAAEQTAALLFGKARRQRADVGRAGPMGRRGSGLAAWSRSRETAGTGGLTPPQALNMGNLVSWPLVSASGDVSNAARRRPSPGS